MAKTQKIELSKSSLFGTSYVYRYWKNYSEAADGEDSIGSTLARAHAQLYANYQKLSTPNLQQIENEYNKLVDQQRAEIRKMFGARGGVLAQYKPILDTIMRAYFADKTDNWYSKLVDGLKWDDAKGHFTYSGELAKDPEFQQKVKHFSLKPDKTLDDGTGKKRQYFFESTIEKAIETTKKDYTKTSSLLAREIKQELEKTWTQIEKRWNTTDRLNEALYKVGDNVIQRQRANERFIVYDAGNAILRELNSFLDLLHGASGLNMILEWKTAEILGVLVGDGAVSVGAKHIQKAFEAWAKSATKDGRALTSKDSATELYAQLSNYEWDQEFLRSMQKERSSRVVAANKEGTKLTVESLHSQVQGKTDITFKYDNQNYNISMKNYSLTNANGQPLQSGSIALQKDSSLWLYISGLEQLQKGLAQHILNIKSAHEDLYGAKNLQQIRKQADNLLTLSIAYAALSGYNQGGRTGREATIFAVADKNGSGKVKMYDMAKILSGYMVTGKGLSITPINNLVFNNNIVRPEADTDEERIAAGLDRTSRIIYQAHSKNISVAISKKYLNSL